MARIWRTNSAHMTRTYVAHLWRTCGAHLAHGKDAGGVRHSIEEEQKKLCTLLDLCVSSLRRGHANLLCIVPILTDDPRRESKRGRPRRRWTAGTGPPARPRDDSQILAKARRNCGATPSRDNTNATLPPAGPGKGQGVLAGFWLRRGEIAVPPREETPPTQLCHPSPPPPSPAVRKRESR